MPPPPSPAGLAPAEEQARAEGGGARRRRQSRVLVSNDDGIDAPGLVTLVKSLSRAGGDDLVIFVAAPDGERSAQSHAITLNREMTAEERSVEGAAAAYAVQGTPADSVMLALNSPLFGSGGDDEEKRDASGDHAPDNEEPHFYPGEAGPGEVRPLSRSAEAAPATRFDLVVSGVNRGDNCGLHVIYSGTVGAAREGACKGVPSVALSLDDHGARDAQAFAAAARAAAAVVLGTLEVLRQGEEEQEQAAWALRQGLVLNVNFPRGMSDDGAGIVGGLRGLALCHQGTGCIFPAYREDDGGKGNGKEAPAAPSSSRIRRFRCYAGGARHDDSDWCDTWAVRLGWASLTPLSLRQDLRLPPALAPPAVGRGGGGGRGTESSSLDCEAQERLAESGMAAASEVVRRAATLLGVEAGGRLLPLSAAAAAVGGRGGG